MWQTSGEQLSSYNSSVSFKSKGKTENKLTSCFTVLKDRRKKQLFKAPNIYLRLKKICVLRVQCILKGWSLKSNLSLVHTQPTTRRTRLQRVHSLPITCGPSRPHPKPKFQGCEDRRSHLVPPCWFLHLPGPRVSPCSQGHSFKLLSWQHEAHQLQCPGHGGNPPAAQRRWDLKVFDGFQ